MIMIAGTKLRSNGLEQEVFILVNIDGEEHKSSTFQPWNKDSEGILSGQNLQDYVDTHEERYKTEVLGHMYLQADLSETAGETELEKFTNWIANGCENPDRTDNKGNVTVGEVIEKVPFTGNHDALYDKPLNRGKISPESRAAYKNSATDSARLAILEKIIFGNDGA